MILHFIHLEHSALCKCKHSVLIIQFHFLKFSDSLLRQTTGLEAQMHRTPAHVTQVLQSNRVLLN